MREFALVFLVSTAVAISVDQVTACKSLVGYPNNEVWNEDCQAKCGYYAGEGKPWCRKVSTAEGLAECVVKFHPDQCQLLMLDPLAECQQALGNPSNPDWDADCDVQCLHYFENGDPWCGDVSKDGSKLSECVLHYQGDHCEDLRKPARSAPVERSAAELRSITGDCEELITSQHENWVSVCKGRCSEWASNVCPYRPTGASLAACIVEARPTDCMLVSSTWTPVETCRRTLKDNIAGFEGWCNEQCGIAANDSRCNKYPSLEQCILDIYVGFCRVEYMGAA